LRLVDFRHYWVEENLYIIGQVENVSGIDLTALSPGARLLSVDGQVLGEARDGLRAVSRASAGERVPFKMLIADAPETFDRIEFDLVAEPATHQTPHDYREFQVSHLDAIVPDTGATELLTVQGVLTNTGGASRTLLTFVGYDSNNGVAAAWKSNGPSDVAPGASVPIGFPVLDATAPLASFEIIAVGITA
jgi:hypothetical protein